METDQGAKALYLDLPMLKRVLTNTTLSAEPDADNPRQDIYVGKFISHYIDGSAISMLPVVRLDNIQACIDSVLADGVPGDFIETGVWRGGATIFMRAALKAAGVTDRTVWVADSFEGLPEPDATQFPAEAKFHNGVVAKTAFKHFAAGLEEVQGNFRRFDLLDAQVAFLPGWFKDTLPTAPIGALAIARLDGDYYESTRDALVNLYDKLSPGGFLIIDDYGETAWACKRAVDEFREARGIIEPLIRVDSKCYYWRKAS
jgi:hypothetical protein